MCHSAEKIPAKEGCQSKRVSKKQQIYPSRVFKYAPLGTTSTAQGSQRCPTGSAESKNYWRNHQMYQQALKFLKSPKKQKSYPSRVTKQTLIGGPLQVPKGAQRYPEGPLRVTLIKKEYDTIHQTLLWALKFLKSPKKQKSYLLQYLCEHPKGVHCRRLGVPTGTQRH